jgi:small neutral amino acid transporter SnatA (MarC family)
VALVETVLTIRERQQQTVRRVIVAGLILMGLGVIGAGILGWF